MTAEVCGSRSSRVKVAPPLKSLSTKFSVSESCVQARASTRVRSSSDLPDPVAPTSRPCGPTPSWALSLRSSSSGAPSAPTPIGTRSWSRLGRGAHPLETSKLNGSVMPSRSARSVVAVIAFSPVPPADSRSGASWRARDSAAAPVSASARPSSTSPSVVRLLSRPSAVTSRTSVPRSSSRGGAVVRSSTVTPSTPPSLARWSEPAVSPPSRTTSTCGPPTVVTGPLGLNRGRTATRSSSWASSAGSVGAMSRTRPRASERSGCWACGSHLAYSHASRRSVPAHTATRTSSGLWWVVSWATTARARASCCSTGPRTCTRPNPLRAIDTGRSGTADQVSTNRRSAAADSGSSSSSGPVCGGTTGVASACGPSPIRTTPKSAWSARRSHSRWLAAVVHSWSGSGCR
ncbi:unannotated protein [freshwater metagenome]|uniref:Unannotated protein n=1 Tax=freshwater metagenome TaxID=449393 RepID=A0A6J7IBZ4_9ZZZZ